MKQFKTESKRLLDLMINSIYTNTEIFLRELISNASDAVDKLYFKSLTDDTVEIAKDDLSIIVSFDKGARVITVSDNGIGMTKEELDKNLGTIAHSDSLDFKKANEEAMAGNVDIIGQFGVGFYSAFMVASRVRVVSRAYGSDEAWEWESDGVAGYTIKASERLAHGTDVILMLKEDTADDDYSQYLSEFGLRGLITK
ncbi:MAG: ATP-binding protein, partial [Eggerthellaceae bacterium]|nr:ATP-binding protein [Eggerthellaceae bacterium]